MTDKIVCPNCHASFDKHDPTAWKCSSCGYSVPLVDGKPVFSGHPDDQKPQEVIERGAEKGTEWRRTNWRFIEKTAAFLPDGADVLDVGAGRGDFKQIFARQAYLGLDIYPYPEADLAVDLIELSPFKEASFDLVVLANVIEHVYEYRQLVSRCSRLLKPGGRLLITVPFLLKLHQEPVDYHRYTRYALSQLAAENRLEVEVLDAYTNPLALLDEGIGDVWQHHVSTYSGLNRLIAKARIASIQKLANGLKTKSSTGSVKSSAYDKNPYVLGYLSLFRKPLEENPA